MSVQNLAMNVGKKPSNGRSTRIEGGVEDRLLKEHDVKNFCLEMFDDSPNL